MITNKIKALLAMLVAAFLIPAALLAYGPERPTYTIEHPATKVAFNSITNNPNIGDERNFVGIREVGSANVWYDNMNVQPDKSYLVRMYVHNNAADNLNLVAQNVTAKFNLPTTTGKSIEVNGFVNSTNATPVEVYDNAFFKSDKDFNLNYQEGSLKFENNVFGPTGIAIPETVFTSAGAKLGYDKLDGKIPGCFKYAGYLSFIVKPQFGAVASFDFTKQVRKSGTTDWSKSVAANPGEKVDFLLSYKNTSTVQENNVWFRDTVPAGLDYENGASIIRNATYPNNIAISDDIVKPVGLNVGSYAPAATAYVRITAKVANKDKLPCGPSTLVNKASVTVLGANKADTATVTVNNVCAPNECKPGIPVGDVRCTECKPGIPAGDARCEECLPGIPKGDARCTPPCVPTAPEIDKGGQIVPGTGTDKNCVPATLPTTGPTETIAALIAIAAITLGIVYYFRSRNDLKEAFKK